MIKLHDKEYFYKYVKGDVGKKVLLDLKVLCRSPLLFNDPFDSQVEIQHDIKSGKELIEKTTGKICNMLKPLMKDGNVDASHKMVVEELVKDEKFIKDQGQSLGSIYSEINKKVQEFACEDRIFCVAEEGDNLLMWAHYAEEHEGAVIKFKCVPEKKAALCAARQVKYSNEIPLLTLDHFLQGEKAVKEYILNEMLLTKSKDWEYEKEWRVILKRKDYGQDDDLWSIFEEEIEAVYLGCRMKEQDKKEIVDIVTNKRKNVNLYESRKSNTEFKVIFNLLGR